MNKILLGGVGCAVLALAPAAADALRDPTRPPAVAGRGPAARHDPPPVLTAIMGVAGARVAIFNGQLVHAGSTLGPYSIEAVSPDAVRYRHLGAVHEVHLPRGAPLKKPSAAVHEPAGVPR